MGEDLVKKQMSYLKDFQRQTVNYVFRRMYLNKNPSLRFLVADEVGLGKTMVASGVIAKAIEHLKGKVDRIDVVYVCSNAAIARQNIKRLNVVQGSSFHLATRLTLIPALTKKLNENKINFISFTPGTTFHLKSSGGIVGERVVLYHLLKHGVGLNKKGLAKLLQAGASWKRFKQDLEYSQDLDRDLKGKFQTKLKDETNKDFLAELRRCCKRFRKYYSSRKVSPEDNKARYRLIGELRNQLAHICIDALEPDLVILDEFQRFKDLLVGVSRGEDSEAVRLASTLMNFKDDTAHDKSVENVRVLLLSATPYRMLTLNDEEEEDHYSDFIETLRFLFDDDRKVTVVEGLIREFRSGLYNFGGPGGDELLKARDALERRLRLVMCRTERVGTTEKRDSMVSDQPITVPLFREDIEQARLAEGISQVLGAGDTIEYWKSGPYLINFMKGYVLKRKINESLDNPPKKFLQILRAERQAQLSRRKIDRYTPIDPGNGRMRSILDDTVKRGYWKLLWMPPSLPYTSSPGVYSELSGVSKSLVFSSWNVVPDAIAALCSYEAERRMLSRMEDLPFYRQLHKKRKPLLRFSTSEKGLSNMSTLALLYPCVTLAKEVDPLKLALKSGEGRPAPLTLVKERAKEIIVRKLRQAGVRLDHIDGRGDPRWHWAALAILDQRFAPEARTWVRDWTGFKAILGDGSEGEDSSAFHEHVNMFSEDIRLEELGAMPYDVVDVLVELALAGPATCALRAMSRIMPGVAFEDKKMMSAAGKIADGFRSLFNQPETIGFLQSSGDSFPYWRKTLQYGLEGNIQSVLDEYVHVLFESLGLKVNDDKDEEVFDELAKEMNAALSMRTSTVDMDEYWTKLRGAGIGTRKIRLRCRFAMRFGDQSNESGDKVTRAEVVRQAFNSPFRPFVLASTSIGQEGLDFHPYCHVVYHWNLPSNPVDMEQREGRVHRFKGHAVRKNLARLYGLKGVASYWKGKGDPWEVLFRRATADREKGTNDLVPYWLLEVEGGDKVERRVPMYPLSREESRYAHLKRSLALYRLVFGQPRQEDLLNHLERRIEGDSIDIHNWTLNLSPSRK